MGVLHLELSGNKSKDVAQLLANDTARRIMDAIQDDSKSESEIAKQLSIPLSTVHYNIGKLVDAGLVKSDEYTYSKKGKEVRHYKLISEHVIITTRPVANLTSLLTGLGLAVLVAATFFFNGLMQAASMAADSSVQTYGADLATNQAAPRMAADAAPETMAMMAEPVVEQASNPAAWPYILLGAGVALIGILIAYYIQRRQ